MKLNNLLDSIKYGRTKGKKVVSPLYAEALDKCSSPILITEGKTVDKPLRNCGGIFENERIIYANSAFIALTGDYNSKPSASRVVGKTCTKVLSEAFAMGEFFKKYSGINPASRYKIHLNTIDGKGSYTIERVPSFTSSTADRHIYYFRPGRERVGLGQNSSSTGLARLRLSRKMLSDLSHEIRTPLNAIIGFSELIKSQHNLLEKGKYSGYIEDIATSGRDLLSTLGSILELTRIESGFGNLEKIDTDASESLKVVVVDFLSKTPEPSVEISLSGTEQPVYVAVEQVVLERIISWVLLFLNKLSSYSSITRINLAPRMEGRVCINFEYTRVTPVKSKPQNLDYTCNDEENSLNLFLARRFLKMTGGFMEVKKNQHNLISGLVLNLPTEYKSADNDDEITALEEEVSE